MGRSLSSCFKIVSCAGDPANGDDGLPQPESKTSPGKRTWSFQKRTFTHHLPSNNVISEFVPTMNNKQNLEEAADIVDSEKASVSQKGTVEEQTNETATVPLAAAQFVESRPLTDKSTDKVEYNIEEDDVVIIQASIRRHLAKVELEKIRKVVKLQAAIRRFLVRRQAVGTLRCIQAILKLQQIIRARHALRSKEFIAKPNLNDETKTEMMKTFGTKPDNIPPAIRKLSSNLFASQLLKSTLQTKAIHISCNPSRPDAGWIWLERWMALVSSDQQKIITKQDDLEENINTDLNAYYVNKKFQVTKVTPSPTMRAEIEGDLTTNSFEMIELVISSSLEEQNSNSLVNHHPDSHDDVTWLKENSDSMHSQIPLISVPASDFEFTSDSNKPDCSAEMHKNSTEKEARVTAEMEVGQIAFESRKSRNSGFAAVQAKFEELTASSSSNRSLGIAFRDTKNDPKSTHVGSMMEEVKKITTLVPDRLEAELSEITSEIRASKETNELSCVSDAVQQQIITESRENATRTVNFEPPVQMNQNSELNIQMVGSTKGQLVYKSSQEGSPISHITVPEPDGTSSNLISMNTKITKAENNTPIMKKRPQLVIDISPANFKNSSGEQTSGEHLKSTKTSKRRNSFSMVKTDHEHQASCSNLIPSYMKPTESARAKVSTSLSQKSSSDVHEKDNHVKKRHSLPSGEVKQGSSPRMQRSTSQIQQNLKGNGIHSPHDSTERRWLR
ncbi:hypothetical protein KSP39_PZI022833 [Platanthera zijinensis]|uniref:DUF4005 domain-containing protein n=1 Tax=Platanthera zijinensis TaxID=2320716 RepID=A0AAP0AWA2_9ASPA